MLKMHNMPLILLMVITTILLVNPWLPLHVKQSLYAVSLTIKSVIIFLLPIIIFSLLFKTAVGLAGRATSVIALILVCVCCSNFISTMLSHFVGSALYHLNLAIVLPKTSTSLMPAWQWQLSQWIPNDKAMLAGIIMGILFGNIKPVLSVQLAAKLDRLAAMILKSFSYFIPVFVAGFVIKLQFENVIYTIIKDYTIIFILVGLAQFSYLLLLYFLLNSANFKYFLNHIQSMFPAAMAGFSAMSSAAAMPLTIAGVEKHATNKDIVRSVIPMTVNIHLIGDCFAIPIFAYAIMKSFGFSEPSFFMYFIFVLYFVIAKFSVAAVPGGGIIVMLPILEKYLGFNAEMLSLITALYILFDPIITCANVFGNGVFAKFIDRLMLLRFKKSVTQTAV